jgi:hypothetical protein
LLFNYCKAIAAIIYLKVHSNYTIQFKIKLPDHFGWAILVLLLVCAHGFPIVGMPAFSE